MFTTPGVSQLVECTFLTAAVVSIVILCRRTIFSPLKRVPGPFWAGLSGLYRVNLVCRGDCAPRIAELHCLYGPVVRTGPNHVLFSEPDAIFDVYSGRTKFLKSDFYRIFALSYHGKATDTVFSTRDPQYHKLLSNQVAARFSLTSLRASEGVVDDSTDAFKKAIINKAGAAVDLAQMLKFWAFDVNSAFAFKHRFGFIEGGDINGIIAGIDDGFHFGAIVAQIPEWNAWMFENKLVMDLLRRVAGLGDPTEEIVQLIEQRLGDSERQLGSDDSCLLTWLQQEQRKDGQCMSHKDLVMHLANYFVAGSVATSTSLGGVFYHLVKNPISYKKLVREIRAVASTISSSQAFTYDQTLQMPYLQAVLKEAMRLSPTNNIPLERRVPAEGFSVEGYDLPAGTNIAVSARMIHRNPDIYGRDVHTFQPERWLDATPDSLDRMKKYFFAFGKGDRACTGRNQAVMEMGKFVPQILRDFDVVWASELKDWTEKSYWMPEQHGLFVKFVPRPPGR